jgi:hypothetical protein
MRPPRPSEGDRAPHHVSMGFEGNRMPADQDRNPTEIPEEPFCCRQQVANLLAMASAPASSIGDEE